MKTSWNVTAYRMNGMTEIFKKKKWKKKKKKFKTEKEIQQVKNSIKEKNIRQKNIRFMILQQSNENYNSGKINSIIEINNDNKVIKPKTVLIKRFLSGDKWED